jgi:molybdenum cofactor synthesis domain-containing protein
MPFDHALGLVLAEDIFADEPMPPFAAASVDGFAVIAADGSGPRRIVGDQMAGYVAGVQVKPGTAARVTTGAPIPSGADAMIMVEQTEEKNGYVHILTNDLQPGANIRPVGQDIETGQLVLPKGTVLGPAELGLLGTVGQTMVTVYRRPKVGVMSTGDEIVEPNELLNPGQIRDANRFTLMAAVRQAGAEPLDLGIVRDKANSLEATIERGLAEADALLTSGGVSMGQLDLVKPYLASRGRVHFGRVNTILNQASRLHLPALMANLALPCPASRSAPWLALRFLCGPPCSRWPVTLAFIAPVKKRCWPMALATQPPVLSFNGWF